MSKIQDFQSIIQVYQLDFESWIIKLKNLDFRFDKPRFSICCTFGVENLGLSSDNPSFQLVNDILDYQIEKLGFHFDNLGFSTYCKKQVENLGLSTENPGFSKPMSNNLKNVDFRVKNLGLSSDNPSFSITYRKSWIINWKSKFFLKILDYQLKILDFRPIIQDVGRKSKIFDLLAIEPTIGGFSLGDTSSSYAWAIVNIMTHFNLFIWHWHGTKIRKCCWVFLFCMWLMLCWILDVHLK